MMLRVADLKQLQLFLGVDADDDDDLRGTYTLDAAQLRAIRDEYGIDFDPGQRECLLARAHSIRDVPYLVHTGYELFLMLEGTKPFAKFTIEYPTEHDDLLVEALFEPHVQSGVLIRRVMPDEPFPKPIQGWGGRVFHGTRKVFYALPGEEWRIDAFNLVWEQLKYGPWNDTLERLDGTLLGYSEEQNNWWIERRRRLRAEGAKNRLERPSQTDPLQLEALAESRRDRS
jgi:hypothetical protein